MLPLLLLLLLLPQNSDLDKYKKRIAHTIIKYAILGLLEVVFVVKIGIQAGIIFGNECEVSKTHLDNNGSDKQVMNPDSRPHLLLRNLFVGAYIIVYSQMSLLSLLFILEDN